MMGRKKSRKSKLKKNSSKKKFTKEGKIFIILFLLVITLGILNIAKGMGLFIPKTDVIIVVNGVIDLDSLSIKQKVAQMVIVQGDVQSMLAWKNMGVGGVHLFGRKTEHVFLNTVIDFQYDRVIPFFVTVDLEGCVNPFEYYKNFTAASEVDAVGAAFEKGFLEGEYLSGLGINLNYAPVVDLDDQIWKCRAFPGNEKQISELAQAYILGLQNNGVIATVKHYPGKALVAKDPHKFIVAAKIEKEDLIPYNYIFDKGDVKAVMITHVIASGEVDSEGIPTVVSKKVIDEVKREYDGLIISDEIHMLGLKDFYENIDDMYIAVFKAGNDVILNFDRDPNEIHRMILLVSEAIENEEISEEEIDKSVKKILEAKGFKIK
jgi:beta-N-acetylhexosaminidase